MRRADAPPPGWYPDPTGCTRLRWWDGLDWTDHRRPPPPAGLTRVAEEVHESFREHPDTSRDPPLKTRARQATQGRDDAAELMAEVRQAARDEVDRAVDRLSHQARDATRRLEPLINQYGDRLLRWLRTIGIVIVALVVLWLVLQAFTQASLMDWLGERIDNLTGGWSGAPAARPGGG